jgi:non-specific serine/threonine protein kinase
VFAGGWTLEAAEAVCSDSGLAGQSQGQPTIQPPGPSAIQNPKSKIQNEEVLDLLTSLVDQSLVQYEPQSGQGRYRLLEAVREYAQERLGGADEAAAVRTGHLDFFVRLAERAEPEREGSDQVAWLDRLEREHDNLRAALDWAEAQGRGEVGLRLGGALGWFWFRSYLGEGRERLARLLALRGSEVRTGARAKALRAAGMLARLQEDYGAARVLFEESLAIFRELGDKPGIAWMLNSLGSAARQQADHGAARALHEESLAIFRELGDKGGIAWSLGRLAWAAYGQGDHGAARALHEESLAIFRELGDKTGIAYSLLGLGDLARAQGDCGAARALIQESLAIFRALADKAAIVIDLEGLAAVAAAQAQSERAACLFGAAEALRELLGAPLPPADRAEHDRSVAAAGTALGEAAFATAWAEGRAMSWDEAACVALHECEIPTTGRQGS